MQDVLSATFKMHPTIASHSLSLSLFKQPLIWLNTQPASVCYWHNLYEEFITLEEVSHHSWASPLFWCTIQMFCSSTGTNWAGTPRSSLVTFTQGFLWWSSSALPLEVSIIRVGSETEERIRQEEASVLFPISLAQSVPWRIAAEQPLLHRITGC